MFLFIKCSFTLALLHKRVSDSMHVSWTSWYWLFCLNKVLSASCKLLQEETLTYSVDILQPYTRNIFIWACSNNYFVLKMVEFELIAPDHGKPNPNSEFKMIRKRGLPPGFVFLFLFLFVFAFAFVFVFVLFCFVLFCFCSKWNAQTLPQKCLLKTYLFHPFSWKLWFWIPWSNCSSSWK